MREFDRFRLQLFARRGGRNYMMRSEKRPSYNRPPQERRPRRRRTRYGYIVLTLIVSILLWPVGLFLIWNRRLRCGVGGKILWSVVTLAVFCGLILALLTVPTGNAEFQRFQDDANDFLETAGADLSIAWETFSERAGDAFGNMRSVACSIGNYALNKAADGIEGGVELGRNVRGLLDGILPADDAQTPGEGGEASASPEPLSAPTPTVPVELPDEEEINAAQLAVAGLALTRAGLRDAGTAPSVEPSLGPTVAPSVGPSDAASSVAPSSEPQQTPYPTPTPRTANAPGVSEGPDATVAAQSGATPDPQASQTPQAADAEPRQTPQPAMAMPTPTPEAEAPVSGPVTAKDAGEFTVYHTENGRYYHTTATCSGMRGAEEHTLASSIEEGFEACPECDAPDADLLEAENAVWVDEDSVYHISDACSAFAGEARLMSAEDAAAADCVPCAACGANAISTQEAAPQSEEAPPDEAKEVAVYFYDGSQAYHAESTCVGMSGAPERTLYEAIEMDKPPCSRCDPPTLEDLQ